MAGGSRGLDLSVSSDLVNGLTQTNGPMPRVLLRAPAAQTTGSLRPLSEPMTTGTDVSERYRLFGELARGGMGVVFLGRDVDLGRELAIKVQPEQHRDDPDAIRRFIEEAQIAGQLQHPGIVPIHELGRLPDGRLYIAMTLVRGRTLAALLEARSCPAEDRPRFLAIFEQVCRTMAYAHTRGVIHRDLKPSNLMVGTFGEVQVMDWGLAKVLDQVGTAGEFQPSRSPNDPLAIRGMRIGSEDSGSRTGSILGTPAYMAPEQARGALDTLDERADVFGLGSILCELLTGAPAFTGETDEALLDKATRADLDEAWIRLEACGADGELVDLARACLAPAARDRPRNAGAVLALLTAYLSGIQKRARDAEMAQVRAEERAAEERKRRLLTAALATSILATAALAGGGWTWMVYERSARTLKIADAIEAWLHLAAVSREQARSTPGFAPAPWIEATEAARRAVFLSVRSETDPALERRARDTLEAIITERRRVESIDRDQRMIERLANIHADIVVHRDRDLMASQYVDAFLEYGINIEMLSVDDVAVLIAEQPIAIELAGSLDHWAFSIRRARPPRLAEAQRLVEIARKADPDPWRDRLRDALDLMVTDQARSLAALEALADSARTEKLTAPSAERLAWALARLGSRTRAIALYREAQRSYPGEFWINRNLSVQLLEAGQFEEAVRFASVAVAIRPRSGLAYLNLGNVLRLAGRYGDAEDTYRHLLRIDPENKDARDALNAMRAEISRKERGTVRGPETQNSSKNVPGRGNASPPNP